MKGTITDISNLSNEEMLKVLYNNVKWNRESCNDRGKYELEAFWSGTLNGIYATLDNLGLNFEWLEGREKDFNEYLENRKHE